MVFDMRHLTYDCFGLAGRRIRSLAACRASREVGGHTYLAVRGLVADQPYGLLVEHCHTCGGCGKGANTLEIKLI